MRDMLEPMLGETGAVVAQFVVTLIVVLALIAVVYWLVRRFAGARLGSIARGRVPRLAIVDAMAIDNRRRLVLVRRDNAEHLILIGGPSDVLIEGPIRRVSARHRAEQQQATARAASPPGEAATGPETAVPSQPGPVAAPAAAPEPASAPPPSPVRTAPEPAPPPPPPPLPARRTEAGAATGAATSPPAPEPEADMAEFRPRRTSSAVPAAANDQTSDRASAQFAEIAYPTAVEPFGRTADDQATATAVQQDTATEGQEAPAPPTAAPADQTAYPSEADERRVSPGAGDGGAPTTAEDESADADTSPDDDTAAKVSDLEREMAKLLGEIGTKRAT